MLQVNRVFTAVARVRDDDHEARRLYEACVRVLFQLLLVHVLPLALRLGRLLCCSVISPRVRCRHWGELLEDVQPDLGPLKRERSGQVEEPRYIPALLLLCLRLLELLGVLDDEHMRGH